jgi:hypothetical protein
MINKNKCPWQALELTTKENLINLSNTLNLSIYNVMKLAVNLCNEYRWYSKYD